MNQSVSWFMSFLCFVAVSQFAAVFSPSFREFGGGCCIVVGPRVPRCLRNLFGATTLGCPPSQEQWQMKVYRDPLLKNVIILVVTVPGRGDNPTTTTLKIYVKLAPG